MTAAAAASICIVTPDLVGIVRNGGVGTACAELARSLAQHGQSVTILFSQVGALAHGGHSLRQAKEYYRRQGIDLVVAEEWAGQDAQAAIFPAHPLLRMSRIVHRWLIGRQFDLITFMDWQGAGFYSLSARRAGLAHKHHGAFVVICHGPTLWSDLGSAARPRDPLDAITYYIERRSIEMADAAISPSRYLLDWMRERGFRLPKRALVKPNLLETEHSTGAVKRPEAVVFFGRLEYRKGLVQFCSAIDLMVARGAAPKRIVFLGKSGFVGDEHAALYLERRSRNWPVRIEIVSRLSQPEALAFLTSQRCLAVVPSTVENSPYTVYECLMAGVPVIARNVGGIAELYSSEHHATHLFGDNPSELADRIAAALRGRLPAARLSFSPKDNRKAWTKGLPDLVHEIRQECCDQETTASQPLVSVCLTHYRRPHLLLQAVRSLFAQSYSNVEVILVDDGSADAETDALLATLETAFRFRGWKIIRANNGFPGKARNIAAAAASGDYLLFFDDDNVAAPEMVETLVRAASHSCADIVTSFASIFEGADEPTSETHIIDTYMPVGGALGYALAGNAISDTSALMKRTLFEALGGFTEDYGLGHEDFELFLRAILAGKDVLVVPEALYWYRRQSASVSSVTPHTANRSRSLRPFLDELGPDMAELLVVAHGLVNPLGPTTAAEPAEMVAGHDALLARSDPDSWQSIDAAAAIVAARGSVDLARQLLLQLPDDAPGAELRRLRADAIEAAVAGDRGRLVRLLHGARSFGSTALRDLVSLAAQVAWRCGHTIAAEFLRSWARLAPQELVPQLLLVEASIANSQIREALVSFAEALKLAEPGYRAVRPDIDAAVTRGSFGSGLMHYERHGRHENAPWPHAETFRRLSEQLYELVKDRRIIGTPDFVRTVKLGFAAFAPSRTISFTLRDASRAPDSGIQEPSASTGNS